MDTVEKYKARRDARLKKRLDEEEWITIKGTHVMVDDDGQVSKGPENIRNTIKNSGGYKPRSGGNGKKPGVKSESSSSYESFPSSFKVGGRKYASPDEVKKVKETVTRFMENAKEGDIYSVGGGVGSAGGQRFAVSKRGDGKLYIGWVDKDGMRRRKPVLMNRQNVEEYIKNGAKIEPKKSSE